MSAIEEIKKRELLAQKAMLNALGTEEDESGVTLFASHHLEELEPAYWKKRLGTKRHGGKHVLEARDPDLPGRIQIRLRRASRAGIFASDLVRVPDSLGFSSRT